LLCRRAWLRRSGQCAVGRWLGSGRASIPSSGLRLSKPPVRYCCEITCIEVGVTRHVHVRAQSVVICRTCYLMLPRAEISSNAEVAPETRSASSPPALGEIRDRSRRPTDVSAGISRSSLYRGRVGDPDNPIRSNHQRDALAPHCARLPIAWDGHSVGLHSKSRTTMAYLATAPRSTRASRSCDPSGAHRMRKQQPVLRRPRLTPGNN